MYLGKHKKNTNSIAVYYHASLFLFFLLLNISCAKTQDTSATEKKQESATIDKKLYYRFTIGVGIGSGYPLQEDDAGIGGTLEFAIQKQKDVYGIGIKSVGEFNILGSSNVQNAVSSIDITYGKVFKSRSLYTSLSAGLGLVNMTQQGKYLSSSGGWFGTSYYEKITGHTIGIPISAKLLWVPLSFTGLGLELYANINSKNTFYGINFCRQFGKLRPRIKNDKNLAAKILLLLLL